MKSRRNKDDHNSICNILLLNLLIENMCLLYYSPILNQNIYDDICIITDEEALNTSKDLAKKEGE